MKPKILFTFSLIVTFEMSSRGYEAERKGSNWLNKKQKKQKPGGCVNTMRWCTHSQNRWGLAPPCFPFFLILSCSIKVLLTVLCFRASNVQTTKTAELLKPLCWRFTIVTEMRTDRSVHNSSRNHSTSDGMFLLLNNLVSLHVNLKIYFPSMLQLII